MIKNDEYRATAARQNIDEKQLGLRAFAYESRNLKSMIASCLAVRDMCNARVQALGELVDGPPPAIVEQIKKRYTDMNSVDAEEMIAHEKEMWQLQEEIRAREEKMNELSLKIQEREELKREIEEKKRWMSSFDAELTDLIGGSQKWQNVFESHVLKLPESNKRKYASLSVPHDQRQIVFKLPNPLYVAYNQLLSAKNVYRDEFSIDVIAYEDGSPDCVKEQLNGGVKDAAKYTAHECYFNLFLFQNNDDEGGKREMVSITFRYLTELCIVVVETMEKNQNGMLVNLFPGDMGEDSPYQV